MCFFFGLRNKDFVKTIIFLGGFVEHFSVKLKVEKDKVGLYAWPRFVCEFMKLQMFPIFITMYIVNTYKETQSNYVQIITFYGFYIFRLFS